MMNEYRLVLIYFIAIVMNNCDAFSNTFLRSNNKCKLKGIYGSMIPCSSLPFVRKSNFRLYSERDDEGGNEIEDVDDTSEEVGEDEEEEKDEMEIIQILENGEERVLPKLEKADNSLQERRNDALDLIEKLNIELEETEKLDVEELLENATKEELEELDEEELDKAFESLKKENVEGELKEVLDEYFRDDPIADGPPVEEEELDEVLSEVMSSEKEENVTNLFPEDGDWIYSLASKGGNVTQASLADLQNEYNKLMKQKDEMKPIKSVDMIDDDHILYNVLDEESRNEILNLDSEVDIDIDQDNSDSHVTDKLHEQRRRLIYDLNYNVTNLFLASFKVNPDAPVILEHWMFELRNWSRYDYVRQNDFNFTWDDVDNANETELEDYYLNAGFDSVPKPTRQENPNLVEWDESPLTFEEERMLAFENWMEQVYHEDDDINLDDDDFMPHHNPAGPDFEKDKVLEDPTSHPMLKDVLEFEEKYSHMTEEWREQYVKRQKRQVEEQKPGEEFRGLLVIACGPHETDLDVAQTITKRMEQEFQTLVFVETRIIAHAKPEDNLFEIWLESWDIDLLHSKRRAVFQRDWEGPRDISHQYIEDMVQQVAYLISDEKRYSYII